MRPVGKGSQHRGEAGHAAGPVVAIHSPRDAVTTSGPAGAYDQGPCPEPAVSRSPRPVHATLHPVPVDAGATAELRDAIVTTRLRLLDVLHARARTLASAGRWSGPHRERYDHEAAELLAAGRALDGSLAGLLAALDAETGAGPT